MIVDSRTIVGEALDAWLNTLAPGQKVICISGKEKWSLDDLKKKYSELWNKICDYLVDLLQQQDPIEKDPRKIIKSIQEKVYSSDLPEIPVQQAFNLLAGGFIRSDEFELVRNKIRGAASRQALPALQILPDTDELRENCTSGSATPMGTDLSVERAVTPESNLEGPREDADKCLENPSLVSVAVPTKNAREAAIMKAKKILVQIREGLQTKYSGFLKFFRYLVWGFQEQLEVLTAIEARLSTVHEGTHFKISERESKSLADHMRAPVVRAVRDLGATLSWGNLEADEKWTSVSDICLALHEKYISLSKTFFLWRHSEEITRLKACEDAILNYCNTNNGGTIAGAKKILEDFAGQDQGKTGFFLRDLAQRVSESDPSLSSRASLRP